MEINTESRRSFDDDAIDEKIEQSFQEEEEENKPKKTSYYHKLVKNMGNLAKKNKGGWFSKMINSGQQEEKKLETNVVNVNFFQKGTKSSVQVLRSACKWSAGIGKKEKSILQGYYNLIDNSKHLYI